jgi:hypothetical protein
MIIARRASLLEVYFLDDIHEALSFCLLLLRAMDSDCDDVEHVREHYAYLKVAEADSVLLPINHVRFRFARELISIGERVIRELNGTEDELEISTSGPDVVHIERAARHIH